MGLLKRAYACGSACSSFVVMSGAEIKLTAETYDFTKYQMTDLSWDLVEPIGIEPTTY
jgi:hypothetical protein